MKQNHRNRLGVSIFLLSLSAATFANGAKWETLPLGSVKAAGWLKAQLEVGKAGMGGHLDELEPDMVAKPFVDRSYDITKGGCTGDVGWCSEISGEYWLGLVELAYTLDDPELKAKADDWVRKVLALQEEDGYLGSYRKTDNRFGDFHPWGSRLCYRALLYYYEMTGDRKYLDAVHKGLLWFVKNWTDDKFTDYVGDTVIEQMALVSKLTGDRSLVDWCDRYAAFHDRRGNGNTFHKQSLEVGKNHVGALATRAILPALLWEADGKRGSLLASERHVADMDRDVGWQANYAPSTDREHVSHPATDSESEYCDFVYYMENFLHLARITGKDDYATRVERIVFNAAMGARKKDDRAIAYMSSPNQLAATLTSSKYGWHDYYEAYAPNHNACCCPANSIRLWPEYIRQAILRKGDAYRIQLYGPVTMKDGDTEIRMYTVYPFNNRVEIHVKNLKGNLEFRRPDWADDMKVSFSGNKFVLDFVCKPVVRSWSDRAGGRNRMKSVEYGPLVFVQPVEEKWTPCAQPTNCEQLPEDWTWFEVTPAKKPVSYAMPTETIEHPEVIRVEGALPPRAAAVRYGDGLAQDGEHRTAAVLSGGAGKSPWEVSALHLSVPMMRLDLTNAIERVTFVPYGTTALRITEFAVAPERQPKPVVIPAPMVSKALPAGYSIPATKADVDPNCDRIPIGVSQIPAMLKRHTKAVIDPSLKEEEYFLTVAPSGIFVRAGTETGAFWAQQTLRQIAVRANWDSTELVLPGYEAHDWPKYSYRGLHLDECRHFMGKQAVLKMLDLMAFHKLNRFHWHLTDDQGWRLELKRHPELTAVGAKRPETASMGNNEIGDGMPYGPYFYTQDEIREVLAYAKARHIEVIPEIEMPGHVRALLAAHPEFSCTGVKLTPRCFWGIEPEVMCAGNDAAIAFMKDVLDEVCELFPGSLVHIGGDECPKDRWKACAKCQARIKEKGLKDEAALETWFANQMARHLAKKGRRAIGWNEIVEGGAGSAAGESAGSTVQDGTVQGGEHRTAAALSGGLPVVMDYFGPPKGAAAIAAGYDIIANDSSKCYFDLPQGPKGSDPYQYFWWGATPTLEEVYKFDPMNGIPKEQRAHVLGGQGNNWTEYTATPYELEWKCWPRACALAEVLWLDPECRDTDWFKRRLEWHLPRLRQLGVHLR